MPDAYRTEGAMTLRNVILAATRALAHLDAARLEELAASCRLLKQQIEQGTEQPVHAEAVQGQEEIRVLRRLVEVTGENLRVLRFRSPDRWDGMDYRPQLAPAWMNREGHCGDD